jgi:hypothetical protein
MLAQIVSLLVPNPAGAVWLGLLVAFVVFGDFTTITSPRNRALLGLLALSPFLAPILGLTDQPRLAAWIFTVVYLLTAMYAIWAARLALKPRTTPWQPNPGPRALQVLVAGLVLLCGIVAVGRAPDDAGYYTNLGAQRWRETGTIPYGDAKLKGPTSPAYGAAATYGPLLYVSHMPAQFLVGRERNDPSMDPMDKAYRRPPVLATQLTCYAFLLVALVSLYHVVRRATNERVALAAVALYAGSPYVLGLGGSRLVISGLAFVSHIAPSAMMLAALAMLPSALGAGVMLAVGAGVLFFPAFLFPLWFGWMLGHNVRSAVRFTIGFAAMGAVIVAIVLWFSHPPPGSSAVSLLLESTLEHQEGVGDRAYGASNFGFWGTHPGLAAFWQKPIVSGTSLFKPTFLLFAALAVGSFFVARTRPRSVAQLAGMTAMLTASIQLWKTHAAGSYVEWYYPFLLIALLTPKHDVTGLES